MSLCCGAVCGRGEGSEREQCCSLSSWASFQSLPLLPTSKLGPSDVDSLVDGFVYILGPHWSNELSCEAGNFSCHRNTHRILQPEILKLYFPTLETWVVWSVSPLGCSPGLPAHKCGTALHQLPPCHESSLPSCPSPPLLSVWANVFSLTPWLLDFHTVWFCGNSVFCLFVFKFVVALLLVCEEAKCIYLHLHLAWKSWKCSFITKIQYPKCVHI